MSSNSTPRICLINLACCWAGMLLAPLGAMVLIPSAFLAMCGRSMGAIDTFMLVSIAGMLASILIVGWCGHGAVRRECLAAHAGGMAAMILLHPAMGAELPLLPLPEIAARLVLGMTPTMVLGFALVLLLFYVARLRRPAHDGVLAPGRGQR